MTALEYVKNVKDTIELEIQFTVVAIDAQIALMRIGYISEFIAQGTGPCDQTCVNVKYIFLMVERDSLTIPMEKPSIYINSAISARIPL